MDWTRVVKLVAFGGWLYCVTKLSLETKHILQEQRARRENEANEHATDNVMAHLYAMKVVLMRNYDGEYEDDLDPDKLRTDFEFARMAYYLNKK